MRKNIVCILCMLTLCLSGEDKFIISDVKKEMIQKKEFDAYKVASLKESAFLHGGYKTISNALLLGFLPLTDKDSYAVLLAYAQKNNAEGTSIEYKVIGILKDEKMKRRKDNDTKSTS